MDRLSSMRIHTSSRQYLRAAETLAKNGWEDPTGPILFLIGQSIELSLKAFLRGSDFSEPQLRGLSHDLDASLDWAIKEGLSVYIQLSDDDIKLISLVNESYKSKDLQYITLGLKDRPALAPVLELAQRLNQQIKSFCLENINLHSGAKTEFK
jgi:hypothetical protein